MKGRANDLIQVDYSLRRKKKSESMKALISKLRTKQKPRQDDPAFKVPSTFVCLYPYMISAQSVRRSRLRILILDYHQLLFIVLFTSLHLHSTPRAICRSSGSKKTNCIFMSASWWWRSRSMSGFNIHTRCPRGSTVVDSTTLEKHFALKTTLNFVVIAECNVSS